MLIEKSSTVASIFDPTRNLLDETGNFNMMLASPQTLNKWGKKYKLNLNETARYQRNILHYSLYSLKFTHSRYYLIAEAELALILSLLNRCTFFQINRLMLITLIHFLICVNTSWIGLPRYINIHKVENSRILLV